MIQLLLLVSPRGSALRYWPRAGSPTRVFSRGYKEKPSMACSAVLPKPPPPERVSPTRFEAHPDNQRGPGALRLGRRFPVRAPEASPRSHWHGESKWFRQNEGVNGGTGSAPVRDSGAPRRTT